MFSLKAAAVAAIVLFTSVRADYYVDPSTVNGPTKTKWCESQIAACPLLCLQLPGVTDSTTASNTCDPEFLTYTCICGNGLSPNVTEYSQTLPYFECVLWTENCVTACGAWNDACSSSCRQDHPCGAQNPKRVNITTTTTSASAVSLATAADGSVQTVPVVYNGFGDAAATTTAASTNQKGNGANSGLDLGKSYSLAVVLAGLFAGFALVL